MLCKVMLVIMLLTLTACTTIKATTKECKQLELLVPKSDECPTGRMVLGITGHPPSCLGEEEFNHIKKHCPNF